ncbi:tetratricopeptide repeat protein [soil metagenome]
MTVIDVDQDAFQTEVLERSATVPVVVDFWAEWCAPCRQLGPVLEQAAEAREGKVVLAKVDTDANPEISQTFGVQGIPAVKAFIEGEVVAEFVGAQGPTQVEEFFDALVPSKSQQLLAAGDEESLRKAVQVDPKNIDAAFALAQMLYRRGDADGALELVANAPDNFRADGLAARIELEQADDDGVATAFATLDDGELEEGLDQLLAALESDGSDRERIRRVIVGILDELGVEHPLARESRRRMSAALY